MYCQIQAIRRGKINTFWKIQKNLVIILFCNANKLHLIFKNRVSYI